MRQLHGEHGALTRGALVVLAAGQTPTPSPGPTRTVRQPVRTLLVDLPAALHKTRAAHGETGDTDVREAPAVPAKKAAARKRASSRNAGRAGGRRGTPIR